MELKQHVIHRKYRKAEAKTQIHIGEDFSVPDGKADIADILQKKAEISVNEVATEKGKIRIQGNLKVWVLYLTDRAKEAADSLVMEFPFDEILYMEGAATGDNLKIDWKIEELQVSIVHPGKLSVHVLADFLGMIEGEESYLVTDDVEEQEGVYTKCASFTVAESVFDRKESYRMREEVMLPANKPNVSKILWKNLQTRGLDLRIQENRIAVKGELLLLVVYEGEEDSQIQWLEQSIPFQGTVEVNGLTQEMFGILEPEVSRCEMELKPDYDGEMRMFQVELIMDIPMHIYEEKNRRILLDAYSTRENLKLQSEEMTYEKLRRCDQAKCHVTGRKSLTDSGRILQILGHQAMVRAGNSQRTEQGILQEGVLEVQVLYMTSGGREPFGSVNLSIPYSQILEVPGIQKEDRWKSVERLDQIFISMAENDQIEVRAVLQFETCVMQQEKIWNITVIDAELYDMEEYKKRPGMVIHFVQPKESLWEIAKNNRLTMEEIKKMNDLTAEEIFPGQKLLLVKPEAEAVLA